MGILWQPCWSYDPCIVVGSAMSHYMFLAKHCEAGGSAEDGDLIE
jgi:hypothetical protein